MEIKNSLDYFKSRKEMHLSDICQRHEDNAILALEKQMPKEPILQGMAPDGYWEVECQECGARTSGLKNYPNYCGRCGHAFKWSE